MAMIFLQNILFFHFLSRCHLFGDFLKIILWVYLFSMPFSLSKFIKKQVIITSIKRNGSQNSIIYHFIAQKLSIVTSQQTL